jgi:hypothetical protein
MDLIFAIIGPVLWLCGFAVIAVFTACALLVLLLRYGRTPLPMPRPGDMDDPSA